MSSFQAWLTMLIWKPQAMPALDRLDRVQAMPRAGESESRSHTAAGAPMA
jgi:hypothetical protein